MALKTIEPTAHLQAELRRSMGLRAGEFAINHGDNAQIQLMQKVAKGDLSDVIITFDTDPVQGDMTRDGLVRILCRFPQYPELESYYSIYTDDLPLSSL